MEPQGSTGMNSEQVVQKNRNFNSKGRANRSATQWMGASLRCFPLNVTCSSLSFALPTLQRAFFAPFDPYHLSAPENQAPWQHLVMCRNKLQYQVVNVKHQSDSAYTYCTSYTQHTPYCQNHRRGFLSTLVPGFLEIGSPHSDGRCNGTLI
eukprot:432320-Pelagomonas_calceolata.AAC.5